MNTVADLIAEKRVLKLDIIKLINDFEAKYGRDTVVIGELVRYNGSNYAYGEVVDMKLHVTL